MIMPSCTEKDRKKSIYIMKTTLFRFILAALDIALISKCTGLSEQQIEKMQKP